ncbi:farnesyltransferase beta subunit [Plasmodium ovale wallikeri]|uniref:Protein farnesyltransferase subunit beta n=2 Tax=Plasmodium ovale TaxID=36330 RepID=A0A1C3KT72_PLAOA|nr:farnesyltransferase beta subunit [Plasmodium ovale wallikeri]SBT77349.1 farnesyltransferase beta subunit, putative [Plasmodium ovale]
MDDHISAYALRYNKRKYFVELLYELVKYERNKDDFKEKFENDESYNYLENILKLLFNYIFNLSKENCSYDTDNNCTTNCYSSSSEALSEVFVNSGEDEQGSPEVLSINKDSTKEGDCIPINECKQKPEHFKRENSDINISNKEKNVDVNTFFDANDGLYVETVTAAEKTDNVNDTIHISSKKDIENGEVFEEPFCVTNSYDVSNLFFNFHLNCKRNTQTVKEKKKNEKQILSIYYKSFSSTVIDILLNNSKVDISHIILFFLFDNVGNVEDISSFFTEDHYTFERIYAHIEQHKRGNNNNTLNKVESKYNNACNFPHCREYNSNENSNTNQEDCYVESAMVRNNLKECTEGEKKEIHNVDFTATEVAEAETLKNTCTQHNQTDNINDDFFPSTEILKGKCPKTPTTINGVKMRLNQGCEQGEQCEQRGKWENRENHAKCQREEDDLTELVNELLREKGGGVDVPLEVKEPFDHSLLKNIQIRDDILITEKYQFQLNKSSVLLNKYISILNVQLEKQKHFKFCLDIFFLKNLKLSFLEASKPWIFYWCIHTIYILHNDVEIEQKLSKQTFSYIKKCVFHYLNKIKNGKGAFGGGLNQYTHIATTYASVCVFIYLHDEENNFLSFLDKKKLHSYILKLKCKDGSFRLHKNGEIDMRGTYCAISICSMCHILTNEVKKNVVKYILSCQNYEGGFTSEKFQESHGGYTYCALATLCILGKIEKVNLNKLMLWLINKQGNVEGAFMGRTNKLVDACYSFWIGSIFFLINEIYILKPFLKQLKGKKKSINKTQKIVDNTGYVGADELKVFQKTDIKKYGKNAMRNGRGVAGNVTHKTPDIPSHDSNGNNSNVINDDSICYSIDDISREESRDHKERGSHYSTHHDESRIEQGELKCTHTIHLGERKMDPFFMPETEKEQIHFEKYKKTVVQKKVLFNMNYLKLYLLVCSQGNKGGMKDKPKEKVDYYHTCYALSGLSLIENYISSHTHEFGDIYNKDNINKLNKIHILYNITVQKVYKSYTYFSPNFPLNESKINHRVGKGAYLYLKRLVC